MDYEIDLNEKEQARYEDIHNLMKSLECSEMKAIELLRIPIANAGIYEEMENNVKPLDEEKEIKITMKLPKRIGYEEMVPKIRETVALELFKTGEFSTGYCAYISGLPYADFLQLMGKHKLSIFNVTREELEKQIIVNDKFFEEKEKDEQ